MKFLSKDGVTRLWGLMKTYVTSVKTSLETSINGVAADKQDTLVSGTNIKTVNGQSLLGSGDITIDLTLYKLVETLPTEGIDENKIYLVKSGASGADNVYTEYMYVSSAWEKIGEYSASVDLSPYMKTADANAAFIKTVSVSGTTVTLTYGDGSTKTVATKDTTYSAATASAAGLMSAADKAKLDGITAAATADEALTDAEIDAACA